MTQADSVHSTPLDQQRNHQVYHNNGCARPRKRAALISVRSETPMDQQAIERVVDLASVSISIEIDKMIEALPRGTDLSEVASDLVARLLEISDHGEFAEILRAGLVARQALVELGIKV